MLEQVASIAAQAVFLFAAGLAIWTAVGSIRLARRRAREIAEQLADAGKK